MAAAPPAALAALAALVSLTAQLPAAAALECAMFKASPLPCQADPVWEADRWAVFEAGDLRCDEAVATNASGVCQCHAAGCNEAVNLVAVEPVACDQPVARTCQEVCEGSVSYTWLVGIGCGTISSVASASGLILQKFAHHRNERLPEGSKARQCSGWMCSGWWWFGFVLLVVLPLPFNMVAVTLAGMSIMAPFSGLPLVFNQLIAPCLLPEKLTKSDVVATGVIVLGVLICAVFGSHCDTSYSADDLMELYTRPAFTLTWIPMVLLAVAALVVVHTQPARLTQPGSMIPAASYAYLGGCFGGLQTIVFKATGELGSKWVAEGDDTVWASFEIYLFLALTGVLAVSSKPLTL